LLIETPFQNLFPGPLARAYRDETTLRKKGGAAGYH